MSRKKTVFLYESKRMRWFALAGIIAGVLFTILMLHEFKGALEDGAFYLGGGINFGFCKMLGSASILIVGCIAVMSIFQFSDWHKKSTQEYLLSLPFTQKERFLAKALCGYGTILLSGITVLLGMIYVRNCYITEFWKNLSGIAYSDIIMGNNTMWQLIQLGLQLILMMLALYSVFLLAHILVSRGIVAALIGTGMSFAPIYLWSVGYVLLYDGWFFREMQLDIPKYREWGQYLGLCVGSGFRSTDMCSQMESSSYYIIVNYSNFWLMLFAAFATIFIIGGLAYWISGRVDMARTGIVVQKKSARSFISAGMGVCFGTAFGLLGAYFVGYRVSGGDCLLVFIMLSIVVGTLVYLFMKKMLSISFQ